MWCFKCIKDDHLSKDRTFIHHCHICSNYLHPLHKRLVLREPATSCACVGVSLKEERVMQQSRDKYFPQLENQGINPVGDNAQITNTCTNNQTLAANTIKGLSIPSQSFAKVRSNRDR